MSKLSVWKNIKLKECSLGARAITENSPLGAAVGARFGVSWRLAPHRQAEHGLTGKAVGFYQLTIIRQRLISSKGQLQK